MDKSGIVYCATNKMNGKIYIGQTTQNLPDRINQHYIEKKNKNNHFHNALRKYPRETFSWKILDIANSIEELNELESYYIDFFDTIFSEKGYNSTSGGNNYYFYSQEVKSLMSINSMGKNNPMYGRKLTEKHKEAIFSSTRKEKCWRARKIKNLDTGEIFLCMQYAVEKYHILQPNLTKCCKGERKTVGGFHWAYYDEERE